MARLPLGRLVAGERDALLLEGLADLGELRGRKDLLKRLSELRRGHIRDIRLELLERAELADRRVGGFYGVLQLLLRGGLLGHRDGREKDHRRRRCGGSEDARESEDAECLHDEAFLRVRGCCEGNGIDARARFRTYFSESVDS